MIGMSTQPPQYMAPFSCVTTSARILKPDEMGRITSTFAILGSLASLFQTVALQNIYKATLNTFPQAIFVIMSALCALAVVLGLVIHRTSPHVVNFTPPPPSQSTTS